MDVDARPAAPVPAPAPPRAPAPTHAPAPAPPRVRRGPTPAPKRAEPMERTTSTRSPQQPKRGRHDSPHPLHSAGAPPAVNLSELTELRQSAWQAYGVEPSPADVLTLHAALSRGARSHDRPTPSLPPQSGRAPSANVAKGGARKRNTPRNWRGATPAHSDRLIRVSFQPPIDATARPHEGVLVNTISNRFSRQRPGDNIRAISAHFSPQGTLTVILSAPPDDDAISLVRETAASITNRELRTVVAARFSYHVSVGFRPVPCRDPDGNPISADSAARWLETSPAWDQVRDFILECRWIRPIGPHTDTSFLVVDLADDAQTTHARLVKDKWVMFDNGYVRGELMKSRKPVPLCGRCYLWGHPPSQCKLDHMVCARCAANHDSRNHLALGSCCKDSAAHAEGRCDADPVCRNCDGAHYPSDRDCPFFGVRFDRARIGALYRQVAEERKRKAAEAAGPPGLAPPAAASPSPPIGLAPRDRSAQAVQTPRLVIVDDRAPPHGGTVGLVDHLGNRQYVAGAFDRHGAGGGSSHHGGHTASNPSRRGRQVRIGPTSVCLYSPNSSPSALDKARWAVTFI